MLTKNEKKWLKNRENRLSPCGASPDTCYGCLIKCSFLLHPDFQDALEFEARAKVIALHIDIGDVPCAHGMKMFCPAKHFKGKGCGDWCRLRMAHLQAEAEMGNAHD